jgi:GntR family transcriptional repressor for pyruvate dehydrogenase complex
MSKHEEIAEALTRDILVGQYRVGERLPSERDLSARFEANRGACREAMKKLEQLGIADIQPGGARVAPLHEASLDVIGYLLALDEAPDRLLVDQILVVINALVQTAALSAVKRLNDEELDELRALIRPLWAEELDDEARQEGHLNMFLGVMTASGNLPVQLIAKSLLEQFAPQMEPLGDYFQSDNGTHREFARQIDEALAMRDLNAIRISYDNMSNYFREQFIVAFDAFEAAQQPASMEASAS